jgi:hypothetical protein
MSMAHWLSSNAQLAAGCASDDGNWPTNCQPLTLRPVAPDASAVMLPTQVLFFYPLVCRRKSRFSCCDTLLSTASSRVQPVLSSCVACSQKDPPPSWGHDSIPFTLLAFSMQDFTFVCPTELTAYSDKIKEFENLEAQVLGVSVDSQYAHLQWNRQPRNQGQDRSAAANLRTAGSWAVPHSKAAAGLPPTCFAQASSGSMSAAAGLKRCLERPGACAASAFRQVKRSL